MKTAVFIAAGLLSGLAGAIVFAALHAVIIVPIWNRMGSGLIFGALAGAVAGWALSELHPAVGSGNIRRAAFGGARFGAILWLLVTPVTAADMVLRAAGIAPRLELVAVGVAVVLALGAGALYGWRTIRRRRAMVAGALATLTLTIAMAGPVPVGRSVRSLGIFLAVLPCAVVGGVLLALVSRRLQLVSDRERTSEVAP